MACFLNFPNTKQSILWQVFCEAYDRIRFTVPHTVPHRLYDCTVDFATTTLQQLGCIYFSHEVMDWSKTLSSDIHLSPLIEPQMPVKMMPPLHAPFKFPTLRNLRNIQTQFKCTSSDELSAVTLKISAINYCLINCGSKVIQETEEKNFVKTYQNFSKGYLKRKNIFKKTNDIFKQMNSSNLTFSRRRKQRNLSLKNRRPSPWVEIPAAVRCTWSSEGD